MSEVSGDFPSRKTRRSSIHVIDATDANSSAPLDDANVSNVSASPSNAPISSDNGTNGKMHKMYKTVFFDVTIPFLICPSSEVGEICIRS